MNSTTSLNNQALSIDYFYDFLQFLQYVDHKGCARTVTGNISRKSIDELSRVFRNGKQLQFMDEEMKWKVRSENECYYLNQIRVTAEAMYCIYKRKNNFFLSKNGKGFLTTLEPYQQHEHMVLWFWNRVNWKYFSPGKMTSVLQKNQIFIWNYLLQKSEDWIDFSVFCQSLKTYFHQEDTYNHSYNADHELHLDIQYGLLERNLKRFGCVEADYQNGENIWDKKLIRFRSTNLGLHLYAKGIQPF